MQEMKHIDSTVCRTCRYYWGEFYGVQNQIQQKSKNGAICSYYIDTGKHRCDDFNPDVPKLPDQDYQWCNKYEERPEGFKRQSAMPPINVVYERGR